MAASDPKIGDQGRPARARRAAVFALSAFAASSTALALCGLWRLIGGGGAEDGLSTLIALVSPLLVGLLAIAGYAGDRVSERLEETEMTGHGGAAHSGRKLSPLPSCMVPTPRLERGTPRSTI